MPPRKKDDDVAALAALFRKAKPDLYEPPPTGGKSGGDNTGNWNPDLNPSQQLIFHDASPHLLGYGEKGSGKSIAFGHKLVRHCYENEDAFAIIIAPTIFTAKEGIWHDLNTLILPAWRYGNRYPEFYQDGTPHDKAGKLMDNGIGLEYKEARMDPETHDRHRWIRNRHGGWSKMVMRSIPYAAAVEARMFGPAPSMVYVEELTKCDGDEYLTFVSAQLGRRRDIAGPQQYTASCNPKGKRHWVYKAFWEDAINKETGERDPSFAVYHVPVKENIHRLPKGYVQRLESLFRDPYLRRQLLDGEWVDRPTGESIFKEYFMEDLHVRGDRVKGVGITPFKGLPIIVSYDPGPRNFCATFMQLVHNKKDDKMYWIVFDELNFVGVPTRDTVIVQRLLERMNFWNFRMDTTFRYEHISDDYSFNQRRPDGSFFAATVERMSGGRIRMRPAPKGRDSIKARVRMVQEMLLDFTLLISATCMKTVDMFLNLEHEDAKEGKYNPDLALTPKRSDYVHSLDALSYAPFAFAMGSESFHIRTSLVEPRIYVAGQMAPQL